MKQEDKELLLIDLSARLFYGVICRVDDGAAGLNDGKLVEIDLSKGLVRFDADYYWEAYIDDIKPYLRPLSSMTEEEVKEFYDVERMNAKVGYIKPTLNWHFTINGIDWLLKHHFDFRGLIPIGLALVAPEGMYDKKRNNYNN